MKSILKHITNKKFFLLFLISALIISVDANAQIQKKKTELISIEFTGNKYFSDGELKNVIVSKESPLWISQFLNSFTSFGSPPSYFDSLAIDDDILNLNNFYKEHGFFKTKISADYYITKQIPGKATLIFHIDENRPSVIRRFKYTGLDSLSQSFKNDIENLITIDSLQQYSSKLLEENNNTIVDYLKDHGYMLAENAKPVVEIDTIKNVVDISVEFKLGKQYKIREVTVEKKGVGKNLVTDKLIKEIANIKPNSYYSYHDLKIAQVRLYRTNLFSSAIIVADKPDSNNNFVPITISTNVGLLNEISPEIIGINDDNTFKLGLGLSFIKKNFLGDARKLTISASAAAKNITRFITNFNINSEQIYGYADLRLSMEQPFLFGKAINTKIETFGTAEKKENEWNANIYGINLNLDFELPKYAYLTSMSSYAELQNSKYIFQEKYIRTIFADYLRREVFGSFASGELLDSLIAEELDSLVTGSESSSSNNLILGTRLSSNNTDDLLFPTRGYSISMLLEDGNLLPYLLTSFDEQKQAAYYKVVLSSTIYLPFFKQGYDALGIKLKIGNIQTYKGKPVNIPLNQRFSVGGSNSIRGWKARDNELALHKAELPDNPTKEELDNYFSRGIAPGGFFLFEGSIEARTHLSKNIGAALFVDYGNVWFNYKDFRFDNIAVASGFGFRYYSEFVPVRIDFGFKLYNPYDRRNIIDRFNDKRGFLNNMEIQIGIGEAF